MARPVYCRATPHTSGETSLIKETLVNLKHSLLLPAFALLAACGGGYSPASILDQAPSGSMEGEDWAMMSAVVRDGSDSFSVSLYPVAVESCDAFASSDTQILFSAPKEVGEYPLRFSFGPDGQTITFVTGPGENLIATSGLLVVEAVSADEVTIGLVADAGDSSINGRFTAPICR